MKNQMRINSKTLKTWEGWVALVVLFVVVLDIVLLPITFLMWLVGLFGSSIFDPYNIPIAIGIILLNIFAVASFKIFKKNKKED